MRLNPLHRLIWSLFKKAAPLFEADKITQLLSSRACPEAERRFLHPLEFQELQLSLDFWERPRGEKGKSPSHGSSLFSGLMTALASQGQIPEITKLIRCRVPAGKTTQGFSYRLEIRLHHSPECLYWVEVPNGDLIARLAASRRKKIFIDVGAHIGSISIPASFLFDEVFALEPCGETHQQLRKNIAMNERRNIQVHQAAAGAEEGNMVLTYAQGQSGGASLIPEKNRRNQEKVAVVTLDNLVHQKVDFLKVDSEGWDLEVLRGARRILHEDQPDLYLELGSKEAVEGLKDILPPDYWVDQRGGYKRFQDTWADLELLNDLFFTVKPD